MTDRAGVNYINAMQFIPAFRPASAFALGLLGFGLLSVCAAAEPTAAGEKVSVEPFVPSGVFGDFLVGRFSAAQSDPNVAAEAFLRALADDPSNREVLQQAFVSCLLSGRSEATQLAERLPTDPVAQLLLASQDARTGNWKGAIRRFGSLPGQGITQLLQPLLVAWAQVGAGQADVALATLRPFVEGERLRGMYALHAGMIADLAGRQADATYYYGIAQVEMPQISLRIAQILASWQARSGQPVAARRTLVAFADDAPDMAIAIPALQSGAGTRLIGRPTDGIAEAYLAIAGALRAEDSQEYAMLMLRLALELRPNLTAARLLAADLLGTESHAAAALQMLASVPANDPLSSVVRMRRADILQHLGRTGEAVKELESIALAYPDSPLPPMQEGDFLRAEHRYSDAIAAYTRAITLLRHPGTGDWPVFYDRGIAYEQEHQWPNAEADFRHALQLAPDQPYVLNYLAYSWADRGLHLTEARAMLQKASQSRPNDGAITDSLGWVTLREGAIADAVQLLERAVELDPEDPTINGHLGDAYAAAGRKMEAQYQWRRALTLNPAPDDMAKLEAKLQAPSSAPVVSGQ